jgi:hypothetical protein
MGLSFATAAGPRQRSHSQILVRLPQPGGPGPRIYKFMVQIYVLLIVIVTYNILNNISTAQ